MSGWIWLIAALVFGAGEAWGRRFLFGPFAIGALLAWFVDLAGAGTLGASVTFALVSLLVLFAVRPIARSQMRDRASVRSSKAALIGKDAIVIEAIANSEGVGCVTIGGEVWTARALEDDAVIERGSRVEVVEIKGATALVTAATASGPE